MNGQSYTITYNIHYIAYPWGRDMWCMFWVLAISWHVPLYYKEPQLFWFDLYGETFQDPWIVVESDIDTDINIRIMRTIKKIMMVIAIYVAGHALFLAATRQLYEWFSPSVCNTFFTMFPSSYHHVIFRSYDQWQMWLQCKRSRAEVKFQGHMAKKNWFWPKLGVSGL